MNAPLKRALLWTGKGVAYFALFVIGLLLATLLLVQTPWAQQRVAGLLSTQLDKTVQGRINIVLQGSLTPFGFSGLSARVLSEDAGPDSTPVAVLTGLKADWDIGALLGSLTSGGPLTLAIDDVSIERLTVDLRADADGGIALIEALTPVPSSEPAPESEGAAPLVRVNRFDVAQLRVLLPATAGNPTPQEAVIEQLSARVIYHGAMKATLNLSSVDLPLPGKASRFKGEVKAWAFLSEEGIPTARASVSGRLQELAIDVKGAYHDEKWNADVEAGGSQAEWQSAQLGWAPADAVKVVASAYGDLEAANARVRVSGDVSEVALNTQVGFDPLRARGTLVGNRVQPQLLIPEAPSGEVNFNAAFEGQAKPLQATTTLELRSSSVDGYRIPDLDLKARLAGETHATFQLRALDESGLELDGELRQTPSGLSFAINGGANRLPDAPGIAQLKLIRIRGLDLDASGTWASEQAHLDASVRLAVDELRAPTLGLSVSALSAQVTTDGPLDAPKLNGAVAFDTLLLRQLRLSQFRMQADSDDTASTVRANTRVRLSKEAPERRLEARATFASLSPLDARSISVAVSGAGETMRASVSRLKFEDSLTVDGLRIAGVGELEGSVRLVGSSLDITMITHDLDLRALSELLTPLIPDLSGTLSANLELKTTGKRLESGHLYAQAVDFGVASSRADQLMTSLVLKKDKLSGSIDVQRAGSLLRVDTRHLDLASLGIVGPTPSSPLAGDLRGYAVVTANADLNDFPELEQALGDLHADGQVRASVAVHQTHDDPLTVSSIVRLSGFEIRQLGTAGRHGGNVNAKLASMAPVDDRQSAPASADEGWSVQQVTADWASRYDGKSGNWSNSILIRNGNNPQPIVGASFATRLPLEQLSKLSSDSLGNAPLWGSLSIPKTRLASLPLASFVPTGLEAEVGGEVTVSGTIGAPSGSASLFIDDLQVASIEGSFPVSIGIDATASPDAVDAVVRVKHDETLVAEASVKGAPQANDWEAEASINEMPLGCFPFIRDYGVAGSLSGDVSVQSGGGAPKLMAQIRATDVEAYNEKMPLLSLRVKLEEGKGDVLADLQQSGGRAQLALRADSPSQQFGDYRPTKLRVKADSFQIRPLMVAVQGAVSDLSGLLDGTVNVDFRRGATEAHGAIRLSKGMVLLPALGKQVRDIYITATAKPGELDITEIEANVERGHLSGTGEIKYAPGGRFLAEARLTLPEDRPLPISNKGRDIAEASGRIDIVASSRGPEDEVEVSVSVPQLDVYFDALGADTVLDADTPDFVELGYYEPDGHFVSYKGQAAEEQQASTSKPTIITVKLGDDVWLHQGTSTFAGIHGQVTAELGEEARLTGSLDLAEGRIDIQGRVFDVRPGTVSFRGLSPPNPDVIAEAAWQSPSGYTIIAMYRGSVQNGQITLRSEPPLSYGEILNVLLFDDPQGESDSEGSSPGASAVAASVASAGLSSSLTSLTNLDIQANIETTVDGSPRPELGVRLSPRLAVEVAYNMQPTVTLSEPPDNAFVSFDWRLSSSWSLESTFGDKGSAAADLSWKYRY